MPRAVYVHEGRRIDYTPPSNVAAGDVVVIGDLVGVAAADIAAGQAGALAIEGVFEFPKSSGTIPAGMIIFWNAPTRVATLVAEGNVPLGKSVRIAASNAVRVWVRLSPGLTVALQGSSSGGSSSSGSSSGDSSSGSSSAPSSSSSGVSSSSSGPPSSSSSGAPSSSSGSPSSSSGLSSSSSGA